MRRCEDEGPTGTPRDVCHLDRLTDQVRIPQRPRSHTKQLLPLPPTPWATARLPDRIAKTPPPAMAMTRLRHIPTTVTKMR